mgnify:CR=1 FL=1
MKFNRILALAAHTDDIELGGLDAYLPMMDTIPNHTLHLCLNSKVCLELFDVVHS